MIAMTLDSSRLVLRNDLAELKRLAEWIEGWMPESVPSDLSFAIQLCLEEAVAHTIINSDVGDDQLKIAIELGRNGERLIAIIDDSGRPFDPTQIRTSALATSLDQAEVGDLGIHLLRSFANGMNYERRDGRNRLTLQFANQETQGSTSRSAA
jgi:serine/threonine-protein kinase RsbW